MLCVVFGALGLWLTPIAVSAGVAGLVPLPVTPAPQLIIVKTPAGLARNWRTANLRSRVDRRVDRISDHDLMTLSPALLVDPLRAVVTARVTAIRRPLFFLWAAVQILSGLWLWRSGQAALWRNYFKRRLRSRVLVRATYIAAVGLFIAAASLPFDFISYRTIVDVGISHQSVLSWLYDIALATLLQTAGLVVVVTLILECVDRSRLWYLWSAAIVFVFSGCILVFDPLVIEPLFHPLTPLAPSSVLGKRLAVIEARAGLGKIPIFISAISRTSEVGNANVAGFGPTRRVQIGDTLLRTATPREIAFVMAHELGHEAHHDPLRITLLSDLLIILCGALAVIGAEKIPLRRDDDELSRLPLVGALLGIWALIFLPIGNAYSRHVEQMADRFGVTVSHDGVAGARMFVRFADEGFAPACPPAPVRLYFYDHPALGSRIAYVTDRADPCP